MVSSAEVEYRAFHHATMKLTWLRILLRKLGFGPKKLVVLFYDNKQLLRLQIIWYNTTKLSILNLIGTTSNIT